MVSWTLDGGRVLTGGACMAVKKRGKERWVGQVGSGSGWVDERVR
jgi:hypothetical protein